MVGLTSRQIHRAKLAIKIYKDVGLPSINKFKNIVSTNIISNFPISVADISNAEKIYVPSVAIIKDNSTRRNPRPVIKDDIKIPICIYKNNSNIWLFIDALFINGVAFLVSIDS